MTDLADLFDVAARSQVAQSVMLASATDLPGFRRNARDLLARQIPPEIGRAHV